MTHGLTIVEGPGGSVAGVVNSDGSLTTCRGTTLGRQGEASVKTAKLSIHLTQQDFIRLKFMLEEMGKNDISVGLKDLFGLGFSMKAYKFEPDKGRIYKVSLELGHAGEIVCSDFVGTIISQPSPPPPPPTTPIPQQGPQPMETEQQTLSQVLKRKVKFDGTDGPPLAKRRKYFE